MNRRKIMILLIMSALMIFSQSFACTNFIVTRGASSNNSVMISYTDDSFRRYGELVHYPAAVYPAGAMLEVYDWGNNKYLGKIKQASVTYNVIGNMNEHQVVIGETTFGGRDELLNDKGIIDYGSLIYITLQRSKTAREAIKNMTDLVEEYGYCSSGESFSIGDKNEAWIMEMIGKGEGNKGAVWVAVKIPDGYVSAHANQARITTFPLNDPQNCLYAKDVISLAREKGYFSGKDSEFSFADAYNPLHFGTVRACDARVWSLFRRVNKDMEKYYSYVNGESTERMPLYIKPERKIGTADVMNLMRDFYQGTELDMTKGVAAGSYGMPYRWRPLTWTYNKETYFNERPISTPQTAWSYVSQSRADMPDEVGGVFWFGFDDTYMTVYTPMYPAMTKLPCTYTSRNASLSKFSWESTFWVFNAVANFAYPKFSIIIDDIQKEQRALEGGFLGLQESIEKQALALLKNSKGEAVDFLTNYSLASAAKTHNNWKQLFETLVVKYMDGVKKDEYFNPVNIGYPEEFKKLIVENEGAKFKMKKLPGEDETNFADLMRAGDEFIKNKKYNEAKKSYQKAVELKPDNNIAKEKLNKVISVLESIEKIHKENYN